jgi:predicted transposase/invertase (TIGR01784 family)
MNRKNLEKCVPTRQEAFAVDELREAALAPEEELSLEKESECQEAEDEDIKDMVLEVMSRDKVFSEVLKAERDYWGDSRNRFIQMQEEKRERDALSRLAGAEKKGIQKGTQDTKFSIARAMLAEGLSLEIIAKCSGLSMEEVISLR